MDQAISETAIVRDLAEKLCHRLARSTIRALQGMDAKLSGDDSVLAHPWDEVCVQVQYDESIYWDVYKETIESLVAGAVEELLPFEQHAIWLQTPEGEEWSCEDEDARDPRPVFTDEIIRYIVSDFVLAAAGRWSNRRIRHYLEQASRRD